ncbi:AbiU2 domain-containing protein [Jiulongibacter sediminis]|uniref:HEPN AbiU2-like domain-containing protein n=1 Tax=Jiulongibacter sediminis TaxID=1605367 RepID=A0A0P7BDY7_9BACT|nr:hypothetical protein [Jiulongibacter sediminis]KPM48969.1 hypothetical protein AFM12_10525 [Jiulongibacter sediminis]TBX25495.1 hypothetical protein TK44_10530 [Jiulongibacter sediminis]
MSTQNSKEVKTEFITKLGIPFGNNLYFLHNRLTTLHVIFEEFNILYHEKNGNVGTINKYMPTMGLYLQNILWDYMLLEIAKFMDPPASLQKKNKNISLSSSLEFIEEPNLKKKLEDKLKNLKTQTGYVKEKRNKSLSHFDFEYNTGIKKIHNTSIASIRETLRLFSEYLNEYHNFYFNSTFHYSGDFISGGARSLLYHLRLLEKM